MSLDEVLLDYHGGHRNIMKLVRFIHDSCHVQLKPMVVVLQITVFITSTIVFLLLKFRNLKTSKVNIVNY